MTSGFKMVALKSAVMTQEYRRKKKKKVQWRGKQEAVERAGKTRIKISQRAEMPLRRP